MSNKNPRTTFVMRGFGFVLQYEFLLREARPRETNKNYNKNPTGLTYRI